LSLSLKSPRYCIFNSSSFGLFFSKASIEPSYAIFEIEIVLLFLLIRFTLTVSLDNIRVCTSKTGKWLFSLSSFCSLYIFKFISVALLEFLFALYAIITDNNVIIGFIIDTIKVAQSIQSFSW